METVLEVITAIRNIRSEMNVPAGKKAHIILVTDPGRVDLLRSSERYFTRLASAQSVDVRKDKVGIPATAVTAVRDGVEVYIPLDELIDIEKELARLAKEKENAESELKRAQSKLSNEGFVSKAPQKVVDEERAKVEKFTGIVEGIKKRIAELENI
jgi:valyl-tRNA synthetase